MEKKKEEIRASVGPSLRDVELDKIKLQLSKESLTIKEIISDGNCLYRY